MGDLDSSFERRRADCMRINSAVAAQHARDAAVENLWRERREGGLRKKRKVDVMERDEGGGEPEASLGDVASTSASRSGTYMSAGTGTDYIPGGPGGSGDARDFGELPKYSGEPVPKAGLPMWSVKRERVPEEGEVRGNSGVESGAPRSTSRDVNTALIPLWAQILMDRGACDNVAALEAARYFRRIVSTVEAPLSAVISHPGLVQRFVDLLSPSNSPSLRCEAAWILTNLASGESTHTQAVVDAAAVPKLVAILREQSSTGDQAAIERVPHHSGTTGHPTDEGPKEVSVSDFVDQACWALGNVTGESIANRDHALECGAFIATLLHLETCVARVPEEEELNPVGGAISAMRNATWTLGNLCRGRPLPDLALTVSCLPIMSRLVERVSLDAEVLRDCAWVLYYILGEPGDEDRVTALLEVPGIVPSLVRLLGHPFESVRLPALRCLGNIAAGKAEQTQQCVNANFLPALSKLLSHELGNPHSHGIPALSDGVSLREAACAAISNIMAGNSAQIQCALDAGLHGFLGHLLSPTQTLETRREAAWATLNAVVGGSRHQVELIGADEVVQALCSLLTATNDPVFLCIVIRALARIMDCGYAVADDKGKDAHNYHEEMEEEGWSQPWGNGVNRVADCIDACFGLDALNALVEHENSNVYIWSLKLLESFNVYRQRAHNTSGATSGRSS